MPRRYRLCKRPRAGGPGARNPRHTARRGKNEMLGTIAVVLVVLWLLGMVTAYTLGGFVHILLLLAVVSILLGFIQGRRTA
jgi:hypothetical protein